MLFKKILKITLWVFIGFTILSLFLFIKLPDIVELQIQKRLPEFLDSREVAFKVQKLGFSNTFISKIRVSKAIAVDSIQVDYTIKSLSSVHLNQVTLSGLSIHAGLDENNQIKLQGLDIPAPSKDTLPQSDLSFLAFLPEKIILQNAKLILQARGDEFLIPFDVLSTIRSTDEKIMVQVLFYPFGEKVKAQLSYDMETGVDAIKIQGKSFDLEHIDPFILKKTKGIQLKGPVDFSLETVSPQKKWKLNLSQVNLVKPIEISIKDLSTIFLINNENISARGQFVLSHSMMPDMVMEYGLGLDLKNNQFDLKLKNTALENYQINTASNRVNIRKFQLNALFNGTPLKSKGKITLGLEEGRLEHQKESLAFDRAKLKSDIVADFTEKGNGLNSTLTLSASKIRIKSDLVDSTFPLADISGRVSFDKTHTFSGNMELKASQGKLDFPEFKTRASDISIVMPIHYPKPARKAYGKYLIPKITYNNRYQFSTEGRILQTDSKEFQVSGVGSFKLLPGIQTQFNSIIGFEKGVGASLEFKIDPVKLEFADIEKLIPQTLEEPEIDVTVSARGEARLSNHQLNTSMRLDITDGRVHVPDMNLLATGLNTHIDLNDLSALKSVPGQVLSIDSIEVNKILVNDAKVRFTLENAESLLIENIRFNWCNGLVSSESIRFPQTSNAYSLTLYCDRLELTQLLEQMGAFDSQGSGTLNGRIPVIYSDGNISFDNGFLFSTPGQGGKLVLMNTDRITAGIPMDSPQFAQLDLAQEALKDFDYKWAKLIFNTFEDDLYVNMELDGKPSRLLPFEYKKELGGFARVDASSPGSHFQGIKLDVNLKLPFNEVMKFGNKLRSIFN